MNKAGFEVAFAQIKAILLLAQDQRKMTFRSRVWLEKELTRVKDEYIRQFFKEEGVSK